MELRGYTLGGNEGGETEHRIYYMKKIFFYKKERKTFLKCIDLTKL